MPLALKEPSITVKPSRGRTVAGASGPFTSEPSSLLRGICADGSLVTDILCGQLLKTVIVGKSSILIFSHLGFKHAYINVSGVIRY